MKLFALLIALLSDGLITYRVTPHDTDPAINRFNEPHYIVFDSSRSHSSELLLFMTGTGGNPGNVSDFLNVAAGQGYRVIGLAYNDEPSVVPACEQNSDPACTAKVRQKRIFGNNVSSVIDDSPAESIVNRFVKLIQNLDRDHPAENWGQYVDGSEPNWARIIVAGHSQGAGMAAYIAQRKRVARVVLFSSPWDFYGRNQSLAAWVDDGPGTTPPDLWFGAYHAKEKTASLIARAYSALKIPPAHIRVLKLEPARKGGPNPYHAGMVANGGTPRDAMGAPAYAAEWKFLMGSADLYVKSRSRNSEHYKY